MYFIDELNGGSLYKYTLGGPTGADRARRGRLLRGRPDVRAARRRRQHAERHRRLHLGADHRRDRRGACPARSTITDVRGVTLGRRAQHHRPAGVQGHRLPAPRGPADPDREGRRVPVRRDDHHQRGLRPRPDDQTSSRSSPTATPSTSPPALPVGAALASPDNLAIDHDGNIYIVEDRNGGVDDDIWFARDLNQDGDLLDAGEGLARWASNGTPGSEFTGPLLRPDGQAPGVGEHPAPRQRQRSHHRDHDPERRRRRAAVGRARCGLRVWVRPHPCPEPT